MFYTPDNGITFHLPKVNLECFKNMLILNLKVNSFNGVFNKCIYFTEVALLYSLPYI